MLITRLVTHDLMRLQERDHDLRVPLVGAAMLVLHRSCFLYQLELPQRHLIRHINLYFTNLDVQDLTSLADPMGEIR